ncbi:DUF2141 domain-containing protein [Flavobacterium chungbukense]|uniref:DUF2141 domain-containing protein n=1 Tax=Flavobacterium chungbukense TaxID=877464 RepID=A0ABP7XLH8_9FLAO|nr:DUF2141 domain-containing protein [Flavobacterium chungbukense]MCC4920626.1 DUF2141 domain-containing protein [Flavobacterium chungbukense]
MIQIKNTKKGWGIVLIILLCLSNSYGQNTAIKISGIRSEKGQIILNVIKNSEDYEQEKVSKKLIFDKKAISNDLMIINCDLEPGTYGITLIDDENKNGELNKNLIGIPKEGFGFSNFFMEKMKKPAFDDFKVTVKNTGNKITIKVKYM